MRHSWDPRSKCFAITRSWSLRMRRRGALPAPDVLVREDEVAGGEERQERELPLDLVREVEIVRVEEAHELAPGDSHSGVPRGAGAAVLLADDPPSLAG